MKKKKNFDDNGVFAFLDDLQLTSTETEIFIDTGRIN